MGRAVREIHEITEASGPIWTDIQFNSFSTLLPMCLAPDRSMPWPPSKMRIAKLAIGLRLFEKQNDRWPKSLDQLEAVEDNDLGPIQPIGPKPLGFKVSDGTAEIWGFHPENASDMTPEEPVDPVTREAGLDPTSLQNQLQDFWEYWHWKLSKSE